jgi:hypothetical protein
MSAVVLVAGSRAQPAKTSPIQHMCGASDRQFIRAAALSNTEIAMLGQDYLSGSLNARAAISETANAALGVKLTSPNDPSLKLARVLMNGMFVEYGRAIRVKSKGGNPGGHMYRSYSLANYAHQVLSDAQPTLQAQGCPVGDLLAE